MENENQEDEEEKQEEKDNEKLNPITIVVKDIISLIKNKAPGEDNINNQALKNLPDAGMECIKEIAKAIISRKYLRRI